MNSIPFIGIPVLNRGDLLKRCVMSIDYPVDHVVIVNNGKDASVERAIDELFREFSQRERLTVVIKDYNTGFAASCNYLCDLNRGAYPYRMLVGSDMAFGPGALQIFHEFIRDNVDEYAMIRCFQGYGIIALTRRGIEKVGGFDESFYPAYFEDNDHHRRLRLLGEKDTDISIPGLVHGDANGGSCTIKSDPELGRRNSITFGRNSGYYGRKWGGPPHHEQFLQPFNDPTKPLNGWTRDETHYQENFKTINHG